MGISESGSPAILDMTINTAYASPTTLAFSAATTTNESDTAPTNQLENCVMDGNPSYDLSAGTGAVVSTRLAATLPLVFSSNTAYGCHGDSMLDSAPCDYEKVH